MDMTACTSLKTERTSGLGNLRSQSASRVGCYFISLLRDPAGDRYIARFVPDPRSVDSVKGHRYSEVSHGQLQSVDWSHHRTKNVAFSTDLYEVKRACEEDAKRNKKEHAR